MENQKEINDFYDNAGLGPVDQDIWETISLILPILGVIKKSVKALEAERYGTILYVLVAFHQIKSVINELSGKGRIFEEVAKKWNDKYEIRLAETRKIWSPLLEVGCFLNPGVDHRLYLNAADVEKVRDFLRRDSSWTTITLVSAIHQAAESGVRTRRKIKTSYESQIDKAGITVNVVTRKQVPEHRSRSNPLTDLMATVVESQERETPRILNITDEINTYSGLRRRGVDPEDFWKRNQQQLPHLSAIAMKPMAVIPSSASCERTFSTSKRIEGLHRAHMSEKVLRDQVIICANGDLADAAYTAVMKGE